MKKLLIIGFAVALLAPFVGMSQQSSTPQCTHSAHGFGAEGDWVSCRGVWFKLRPFHDWNGFRAPYQRTYQNSMLLDGTPNTIGFHNSSYYTNREQYQRKGYLLARHYKNNDPNRILGYNPLLHRTYRYPEFFFKKTEPADVELYRFEAYEAAQAEGFLQ